jgi:hypothetical protein
MEVFSIAWRPEALSASFHGRDVFAPVAAMLACGDRAGPRLERKPALATDFGADDLAEIIYLVSVAKLVRDLRRSLFLQHPLDMYVCVMAYIRYAAQS